MFLLPKKLRLNPKLVNSYVTPCISDVCSTMCSKRSEFGPIKMNDLIMALKLQRPLASNVHRKCVAKISFSNSAVSSLLYLEKSALTGLEKMTLHIVSIQV